MRIISLSFPSTLSADTFELIVCWCQAKQIVGSTLLVKANDRPTLEDGEFYVPELVGMKVILKVDVGNYNNFQSQKFICGFHYLSSLILNFFLSSTRIGGMIFFILFPFLLCQETREPVGTVVNVFNCGSSDLLQVKLFPAEINDGFSNIENAHSGHLVWIPFVEAIVPDVDMNSREMLITPPKGLLELNIRHDRRSKKERRQLVSHFLILTLHIPLGLRVCGVFAFIEKKIVFLQFLFSCQID